MTQSNSHIHTPNAFNWVFGTVLFSLFAAGIYGLYSVAGWVITFLNNNVPRLALNAGLVAVVWYGG